MNKRISLANILRWLIPPAAAAVLTGVIMLQLASSGRFVDREGIPAPGASGMFPRVSSAPERIVLTWTGDPATTQAVTWRTSAHITKAYAEVAEATPGPEFQSHVRRLNARTHVVNIDDLEFAAHSAEFKDLKPGGKYVYRVGDGAEWSEWFQFKTAAASPEPFDFVYFGDAQNDIRSLWSRVIREAYSDAPKAAFMLHAGDLVNKGEVDLEWDEWFGAGGWLNATIPIIATAGNHEYITESVVGDQKLRRLSRYWPAQFTFPRNGPPGLEDTVYYVDYLNLRVVVLNSNEQQEKQVAWLDQVLANHRQTWTAITFHHPFFSPALDRDNAELRAMWKPVFDRHHVDLVLNGHDHSYGRTGLIGPEANEPGGTSWRSSPAGTVYVVSVSGPKMYDLSKLRRRELNRIAGNTQLYQIVHIDGNVLKYEARMATGGQYDGFTLEKRPGQPNALTEQVPSTPERLPSPTSQAADDSN